jgi:hypothetical protein
MIRPHWFGKIILLMLCGLFLTNDSVNALSSNASRAEIVSTYAKWDLVEFRIQGRNMDGRSSTANPFRIALDGVFRAPDGSEFVVPGFYDGDGAGHQDGNIWKIRFVPHQAGSWTMTTSSSETMLNGLTFQFDVQPSTKPGMLRYVGGPHLKYSDGTYWLKTGIDDPEEFLGEEIMGGWDGKRAAVDYLSSKGINSMYLCLMDYPGDSGTVFPWLDPYDQEHFDVAKMSRWDAMFDYMRSHNIVLHLVLEDDDALVPDDRAFYYRYLVARFAHHTGLIWNLREEYNERYSPDQVKQYAQMLQNLDPYRHPVTLHNVNMPEEWFLNAGTFSLTSIQTEKPSSDLPAKQFNSWAIQWRDAAQAAGRPIMVSYDEMGKTSSTAKDRQLIRQADWALVMAGAHFELHIYPLVQYQDYEPHLNDILHLREFMQRIPFWDMRSRNDLVSANAMALARSGAQLVVYAPTGGAITVNLSGFVGSTPYEWYDPKTGTYAAGGTLNGGQSHTVSPPFSGDAVLHVGSYTSEQEIAHPLHIGDLNPTSYQQDVLQIGKTYYIDRSVALVDVPAGLQGLSYIKTANNDKGNVSPSFLSFTVDQPANIYIAYDSRVTSLPHWLIDNFVSTNYSIGVSDKGQYLHVWSHTTAAGTVKLGGNSAVGFQADNGFSMYFVIVQPYQGSYQDQYPPAAPKGLTVEGVVK